MSASSAGPFEPAESSGWSEPVGDPGGPPGNPTAAHAGSVTLVGAGPGAPDLLTLRAVRAIAAADVILVDDLVDRRILAHARPDARVVDVGKRGGCASTPQAFIERLLASEAMTGRRVVRLKGGDPFLFGRGGEEVEHLRAQGIPVDVVPGITSGMAATAAIGVPLTHRDCTRGAVFVTGHAKPDGSDVDWAALAATGLTLVIYMGVARVARIRAGLLDAGMARTMPVAVVQDATRPGQRALVTTLDALERDLRACGLGSPAIMVVGDVVRFADVRFVPSRADVDRTPAGGSTTMQTPVSRSATR